MNSKILTEKQKAIADVKEKIRQRKSFLQKQYKTKELGIFGSYTKGRQSKNSDVDILVEFSEPVGFFTFLELEEYLENLLGREVDLVTKKALKPGIGKCILQQVSYI